MKRIKVKLTLTEELLGTASANPELHREYIASKAPNAQKIEEEVAALGVEQVEHKATTVFPRTGDDQPFLYDYQIKGFFKDSCSALARVEDMRSSKLKAHKKVIDGLIFVQPRKIVLTNNVARIRIGNCQRPLRAQTAQGERIALANSETVPEGTWLEFEVVLLDKGHEALLREWFDYGGLRGLGQWRNSGKGRFIWEELK